MLQVIFICSGNTCRSPMAAAIASCYSGKETELMEFASRGLSVAAPARANPNAVAAVRSLCGYDLSAHIARQLSMDDILSANLLITMTRSHKNYLEEVYLETVGKTFTFYELAGQRQKDVEDPFGSDAFVYRQLAETFTKTMDKNFWNSTLKKMGKDV